MPLTPAEIHHMEFAKAAFGKRGYDAEDVDSLLGEAGQEMVRLIEENAALMRRLEAAPPADDEYAASIDELARLRAACHQAEVNARQLRHQLDEAYRAAPPARPAQPQPDQVLKMAQRTADGYLNEAHEASGTMVADARERSDRMVREAQALIGEIDRNARRHQAEAARDLEERRAVLLRDIDEMTGFVQNYYATMEGRLLRQNQLLDGTGSQRQEA